MRNSTFAMMLAATLLATESYGGGLPGMNFHEPVPPPRPLTPAEVKASNDALDKAEAKRARKAQIRRNGGKR